MGVSWDETRLKYQFKIIGGNGFAPDLQGKSEGDYPFCKCSDISNGGEIDSASNYVSVSDVAARGYNVVPKKSILSAKIGGQ